MQPAGSGADLSALFDAHVADEFVAKHAALTITTMVANPTLIHVPVLTGGRDGQQVFEFYRDQFIPSWPDDVEVEPLPPHDGWRARRIECIVRFTHTREMPVGVVDSAGKPSSASTRLAPWWIRLSP